jgi:hypothetical protein
MTSPRLSAEQRRALTLLASIPHGIAEELLILAHQFDRAMIAGFVRPPIQSSVVRFMLPPNPPQCNRHRTTAQKAGLALRFVFRCRRKGGK